MKGMTKLTIEYLERAATEFSVTFLVGMINRMTVSQFKYGNVADAYPHKLNAIVSLLLRLRAYLGPEIFEMACHEAIAAPDNRHRRTIGNTEYLMDAANFAMIEFMHPRHPDAHFEATDSDQSTGRVWVTGRTDDQRNNHEAEAVRGKLYRREGD